MSKLEEIQKFNDQFEMFKQAVVNKKTTFGLSAMDLVDMNSLVVNKKNAMRKTYKNFLKGTYTDGQKDWIQMVIREYYVHYDSWDANLLVFSKWLNIRPPTSTSTPSLATTTPSMISEVDKARVTRRDQLVQSKRYQSCLLYTSPSPRDRG